MTARGGFLPGLVVGALVALLAVLLVNPSLAGTGGASGWWPWISVNLGHSVWLFSLVLVLFVVHLARLRGLLEVRSDRHAVVELDQLTDVWIHVFIGIGVVWTAVGMRAALQVALADSGDVLADSAGSMLRKLVDGGILLALSTTILGAVGGYLMRLVKTLYSGAALHDFYDEQRQRDLRELLATVQRLERSVAGAPAAEDARGAG